jgi:hypothetical protein
MNVEAIGLDAWRDALPASDVEVFHDPDALEVLDAHADGELRLFAGYKGDNPVALLPVFIANKRVGRTILSPPPGLGVPRLGPVLDPNSPKQRKRERVNRRFAEGLFDHLDVSDRSTLFRMICPLSFSDPRPYGWNDLDVSTEFTYVVDLGGDDFEDVMGTFSRSLRREMRSLDDLDLTISTEGADAAVRVYDHLAGWYEEQGEPVPMSRSYVRELVRTLDDDRCRVYVARTPDGDYLSGLVVLFSNDHAYYWSGGVRESYENVSVNTLLHRAVMEDIVEDPALDSVTGYDLVGANTERLCEYKAKFNGELVPYYVVESGGPEMALAKTAYSWLSGARSDD